MKTIDWSRLVTIQDWADILGKIMDDARKAVERDDPRRRLRAQKLLLEFTKNSPAMCAALDEIATRTASDLFLTQLDASTRAIAARRNDLDKARTLIHGASDQAKKEARTIRFETALTFLDKSQAALEAVQTMEEKQASPDANLLQKIAAVLHAIEELRDLGPPR